MSYREVTSTMKYVKTFSFQVHPLQPTLMELFTFATKALQLLGTKLADKEHPQFHFHKLFCFKQHFRRFPNLNTISGRSTAYNVQERPSIKTALMLRLRERLFDTGAGVGLLSIIWRLLGLFCKKTIFPCLDVI